MLSTFQGAVAECQRSRKWSNLDKELIHVARETRLNGPILIIYRLRRQHRPQIDLHSRSLLLFYDRPDPCRPIIGDLRTPLLLQQTYCSRQILLYGYRSLLQSSSN